MSVYSPPGGGSPTDNPPHTHLDLAFEQISYGISLESKGTLSEVVRMLVRFNQHVLLPSWLLPYPGYPFHEGKEQRAMLSNCLYKPPHTSASVTSLGPIYPMNESGSFFIRAI